MDKHQKKKLQDAKDRKDLNLRNNQRKVRKAMNLDDESFYKKELKGLNAVQKRKLIRKRNQLLNKEKRKRSNQNKQLKDANKLDNNKDANRLKKTPQINGKPSTSSIDNKNNFNINNKKDLYDDGDNISQQNINERSGLFKQIDKLKLKNKKKKKKKKKKRHKRQRKFVLFLLSSPIAMVIFAIGVALFIFSTTFFGGIIVSMALSHPKLAVELAEQQVLGNAIDMGNTKDDVKDKDGKVILKGKGEKSTAGKFEYNGMVTKGGGGSSSGSKDKESGSKVTEADESSIEGKIWNKLRSMNYSKEATAGEMGNMKQESTFRVNATNGTHTGMYQWDNVNRYPKAKAYCESKGQDITKDWECQVEYADIELKSSSPFPNYKSYDGFKKADNVGKATYDFEEAFEKSGGSAMETREMYAQEIYDKYAK